MGRVPTLTECVGSQRKAEEGSGSEFPGGVPETQRKWELLRRAPRMEARQEAQPGLKELPQMQRGLANASGREGDSQARTSRRGANLSSLAETSVLTVASWDWTVAWPAQGAAPSPSAKTEVGAQQPHASQNILCPLPQLPCPPNSGHLPGRGRGKKLDCEMCGFT